MSDGLCKTCGRPFRGINTQAVRDAMWAHDEIDHRNGQLADIHQLPAVGWHRQALTAILDFASKGEPFVISAALLAHGVPDAPNPRTDYSNIQREAVSNGWIEPTGKHGKSVRPTTKGSGVTEWRGTARVRRVA